MIFSTHLKEIVDLFLHLNLYLAQLIQQYGVYSFAFLFLIIFCETGLIITPFLPGDSLLFAVGGVVAATHLNIYVLIGVLILAAFLGDNTNYWIGRTLGRSLIRRFFTPTHKILKTRYLTETEIFYEKYGLQAIIIARFVPFIRTFCPFVAGVARMRYSFFAGLSLFAAFLWVGLITYAGYKFGNIPVVKAHFSWVILLIIVVSLLPLLKPFLQRIRVYFYG